MLLPGRRQSLGRNISNYINKRKGLSLNTRFCTFQRMLDKRRINTINQGWQNALDSGATQIHCQAALVGQFLHHRSLETWPALGAWYSGPAKRELVGDDQVYFDLACDTLEKAIRKEALALMNGETTLVASDNGLATCFPSLDQELLKELRAYSISDFAGSLV